MKKETIGNIKEEGRKIPPTEKRKLERWPKETWIAETAVLNIAKPNAAK